MPVWGLAVRGFVRNIVGRHTAVRHFVSRSGGRSVRSAHAWTMRPRSVSQSVELQERFDQRLFALAHVERQESRRGGQILAVGQHNRGERSAAEEVGVLKIDARRHKEVGETFRLGRYKRLVGRKGADFRYGNDFRSVFSNPMQANTFGSTTAMRKTGRSFFPFAGEAAVAAAWGCEEEEADWGSCDISGLCMRTRTSSKRAFLTKNLLQK